MRKATITAMAVLLTGTTFAFADTATLYPTDDAYIWQDVPDYNFGDQSYIFIGYWGNSYMSTLIGFDLSPYAGATIDGAYLRLYVYNYSGTIPSTNIKLGRNTAYWTEETVTWNNRPNFTDYYAIDSPVAVDHWWIIEVTDYVQGFVDGSYPNYGFRIGDDNSDEGYILMWTKEEGDYTPELLIYYTPSALESETFGAIKALFE